ncbi:alpha/beta fold hydrolase [Piscinibacter sakaiensis]|uniref:alpha/beta fold hydrolase n=1 Tax=Piscinibacter sakaiensis TaxID=1547922 RepID=UPI00372BBA58
MTEIETFDVALPHGIRLACRAAGDPQAPCILLLHGFPEAAFVWDDCLRRLGGRYRLVAPNLRGYAGSSAPPEVAAYRPKHLVADLVALIEALGGPLRLLVAHDWGGAVAWNLAAAHPALMERLLIINSPHPATFLRELRDDPAQAAASAYMNFLARPDAAALLAADDFRRLWTFFTAMGADDPAHPGGGWLDEATRERYRAVWRQGLDGALNYYRASPLRPADPRAAADPVAARQPLATLQLPDEAVTVRVPTRVLWADGDTALLPGLLRGLEAWVPELRVERVPGATHWIVHER